MTSKLKCPFCGGELDKDISGELGCPNDKCKESMFLIGTEELWQALTHTKKQLDRAKWWLKEIVENHRYTPITTAEMALKELTMVNKTKIMDVLLRVENDSYLQEYTKPETSDYFIMTDDGKNNVLGTDRWIGQFYTDNRDGLKESYALVPFFYINDALRYSHYRCISYSSREEALDVLERIKPKLIEYFGVEKWVVKRMRTVFYLEDCDGK